MSQYTEDQREDAAHDAAMDHVSSVEKGLIDEDPNYAWRYRVCKAMNVRALALYDCHRRMGITDMTEVYKIHKRIKHLEKWLKDTLDEELSEQADAAAESSDPYKYYGVSRSDFL